MGVRKIFDDKHKVIGYSAFQIKYNPKKYECDIKCKEISTADLIKLLHSDSVVPINSYLIKNSPAVRITRCYDLNQINRIANMVRKFMVDNYGTGTDLAGHCIEASEYIVTIAKFLGFKNARTVEGWCRWDADDYGSDRPYDPHTWAEICGIYVDVTADQFNCGMYKGNEYRGVILGKGLPHGMRYDEPQLIDDEYYE